MTSPRDDIEGRIAMQANAIVGDAMREAFRWEASQLRGVSYFPPLLADDLSIHMINVAADLERARIFPPIGGQSRKQARR